MSISTSYRSEWLIAARVIAERLNLVVENPKTGEDEFLPAKDIRDTFRQSASKLFTKALYGKADEKFSIKGETAEFLGLNTKTRFNWETKGTGGMLHSMMGALLVLRFDFPELGLMHHDLVIRALELTLPIVRSKYLAEESDVPIRGEDIISVHFFVWHPASFEAFEDISHGRGHDRMIKILADIQPQVRAYTKNPKPMSDPAASRQALATWLAPYLLVLFAFAELNWNPM